MKTEPLHPAHLAFNEAGLPCAPDFGTTYPGAADAEARAQQVFLAGNQLPRRWAACERFVVLETGFGLGHNFLATWAAWRADPQRCGRLVFISVEKHPLRPDDLARVLAASPWPALAAQLLAQWPVLTPNLQVLDFEAAHVQLLLALGDARQMLGELQAEVDAFYLDGFSPQQNPGMWTADIFKRLARLATPGATLAASNDDPLVAEGLRRQGFVMAAAPAGAGGRLTLTGLYTPRYTPPRPAAFRSRPTGPREALILGGGLAGCAAAWALAQQGWRSTVLDRQPEPAMETSGNPGGLMHGIFNADDGLHARWFRAAALHTERWARPALAEGAVAGQLQGLLRLDPQLVGANTLHTAQARLAQVGLDPAYLSLLDPAAARALAQIPLPAGAWWYRQAGWLSPRDWSRWLLSQAQGFARWQGGQTVARVQRAGAAWQALDNHGGVLAEAPVLVLAHALGTRQVWPEGVPALPLRSIRGQTTLLPALLPAINQGARPPALPISGLGYALELQNGSLLLGATSQAEDADPQLRQADHVHNLQRAVQLGVWPQLPQPMPTMTGRVGWRASLADRLPLIGPLVDVQALGQARAQHHRMDAQRHLPRLHDAQQGLYVFTGLGSRGLTSAALGARVLAAWITGAPFPVENSLRDALDPARCTPLTTH